MDSRLKNMRLIAKAVATELAISANVLGVWLTGSAARGDIWEGSDIDIQALVVEIKNRFLLLRVDGEDVVVKFFTRSEIEKQLLEDKVDPFMCAFRESIILFDRYGDIAELRGEAEEVVRSEDENRREALERLEEMYEDWHGAVRAHHIDDAVALAHWLMGTVSGLVAVWHSIERRPVSSYAPSEETLAILPSDLREKMKICLGITQTDLEARYKLLKTVVRETMEKFADCYGEKIARLIGEDPKTLDQLREKLGAGIPRELLLVLSEKAIVRISTHGAKMGGREFLEELYEAKN